MSVAQAMDDMMKGFRGKVESGELVTREQSAGRLLSQAVYARWSSDDRQWTKVDNLLSILQHFRYLLKYSSGVKTFKFVSP